MPMPLKRFKHFGTWLRQDDGVLKQVNSIELFRYHSEKWYDENDCVVEDPLLSKHLLNVHESMHHWRAPKSTTALIDVLPYDAVARVTFSTPPKRSSLDRVHDRIEAARKYAEAVFNSVHDSLTGLLNGKGFRETGRHLMLEAVPKANVASAVASGDTSTSAVAMFAMDIDHFKQVNDTHGHMYGDVVLQCLARRLGRFAEQLETKGDRTVRACVGRPSGEEFLILVTGAVDTDGLKDIGEQIRRLAADDPLPNDEEWVLLATAEAKKNPPPPLASRRLTMSVGVASMPSPKSSRVEAAADTLRNQADRGLYSAKAGGRNAVRLFSEILSRYGRILEHHSDTQLVAIDLGRQVDVGLGQEFHVVHPSFDGETDFIRNDGRSNKVLGRYPRHVIGRIEVIDVQEEISFCHVLEKTCPTLFPVGSRLEAIPIGSISHLVSSASFGGVAPSLNLTSAAQLKSAIAGTGPAANMLIVAVFALDDVERLVKQRGTRFVNTTALVPLNAASPLG